MPPGGGHIYLPNALWSLFLFLVLLGLIWYKMHRLRLEIKHLVEELPKLGSQFVKAEVVELRDSLQETRARVTICEERLGLDGETGEA